MQQPRSRWRQIRRRWIILLISVGVLIILVGLVSYGVIRFGLDWTGFVRGKGVVTKATTEHGIPVATQYLPGKTLWDWMQLLLVPILLAIGGFWLNYLQKKREERTITQQAELEHAIVADNQQETVLQAYIDKIGDLLLREGDHLGSSPGNPQVENIARARTVTGLRILNPVRRASLLRFLGQASVLHICTEDNLKRIDLHDTELVQIDFNKFNLSEANLSGADLWHANLSGADLREANLSGAFLRGANLSGTDLRGANLREANLREVDLREVDLRRVRGTTDEEKAMYQSRGALVDLIFISPQPGSTSSPSVSLSSQNDESLPSPQVLATLSASDTLSPTQGEDVGDASRSDEPPVQLDSSSQSDGRQTQFSSPVRVAETPLSVSDAISSPQQEDVADIDGSVPPTQSGSTS